MAKLIGKWSMESSESFDEYMKAVGVGFMMRKLGCIAKPTVTISQEGDDWSIKSETTFSTLETKFNLGKEFEECTADGRKMMTTFLLDGENKLVQDQKGKVPTTITREVIDDNTMICMCDAENVSSKRVYKRLE